MKTEFCKEILKTPVFILLLLSNFCLGQGGWMRKYDLGTPGTVFTSVLPKNAGYFISGIVLDTVQLPSIVFGACYLEIDENGEELNAYRFFLPDTSVMPWSSDLTEISNNSIANAVHLESLTQNSFDAGVLGFDTILQQFRLFRITKDSIYKWQRPFGFGFFNNKFQLLCNNELAQNQGSGISIIRGLLLDYSPTSEQTDWSTKLNGTIDSLARVSFSNILQVEDSSFIIGYNSSMNNGVNPSLGSSILKKIDKNGQEVWSYNSHPSSKEWLLTHLYQNADKSIVYAGNAFVDKLYANGDCCFYTYRGRVVKIDTLGNRLWERNWGYDTGGDYPFQAMHVNTDESVIAVGVGGDIDFTDTLESGQKGYITKTSANGDSLWSRLYLIRNQQYHWHNFMDIEATSDGGYILCGRSTINGPVFPDEQFTSMAWIVKVDSMGCVVPGCHLVGVDEETKQRPKLLIYPNPAHDYLSLFVPAGMATQQLQIQLLNLEGKVVLEDQFNQSDATYLLELKNISAGLYVLKVLQNGEVVQAEKVVVE
jgi:hypothetical protein